MPLLQFRKQGSQKLGLYLYKLHKPPRTLQGAAVVLSKILMVYPLYLLLYGTSGWQVGQWFQLKVMETHLPNLYR